MRFEFATAGRIVFGPGALAEIGPLARAHGRRAFVVTGRDAGRAARLLELLRAVGLEITTAAIAREPTIEDAVQATAAARAAGCDLVIGVGGGAALDTAKAVAALLANPGDPLDHLEVVGRGQPLAHPAAPCLAIPTTAGTGSEVTRNAVLASPAHRVKASLRHASMLPRVALIDPELTHDLPPALTAATGLDALTQLIEPYLSSRANPITDALCAEGLRRAARSLRRAVEHGRDAAARADMALASLHGGLALANAGLGAVHGLAGPIGGMFPAPHGAVCAALLSPILETNYAALRARAPQSPALPRFAEIARLVSGAPRATADDLFPWVSGLVAALRIPPLRAHGITPADVPAIVAAGEKASSMKANPIALTADELAAAITAAL